MIIDGHSHVTLPVEEHIQQMNRAGIDKTILFSTTFHPELAENTKELKEKMKYLSDLLEGKKGSMLEAREASVRELVDVINQYPKRYIGFGAVPVGHSFNDTKQYIESNIIKNNLAGIGEFALGIGQAHLLENIFQAIREIKRMPIWIHTFNPYTAKDILETAAIAEKNPEIPVIFGHLGGTNWMTAMDLATEIPNLYLDTSAFFSTFVLRTIINEIPEKCIFGVDCPFGDLELSKKAILKYADSPQIASAILGENIARILEI